MLKDVTLLIPVHKRHEYLTRLLDYYRSYNLKIIIADNSPECYAHKIDSDYIQYYHWPNIPHNEQWALLFDKLETPYGIMCAQDDFVLPSFINKAKEFLDENKDYSSVMGAFMHYTVQSKRRITIEDKYPVIFDKLIESDFHSKNPEERLSFIFNNFIMWVYSFHRREVFSMASKMYRDVANYHLNMSDRIITSSVALSGNFKIINELHCIREKSVGSIDNTFKFCSARNQGGIWQERYYAFIKLIASRLKEKTNEDLSSCIGKVQAIIEEHCLKNAPPKKIKSKKLYDLDKINVKYISYSENTDFNRVQSNISETVTLIIRHLKPEMLEKNLHGRKSLPRRILNKLKKLI